MIVDSHAHAFPPMGGPSGHRTAREHMRYVQHMLMFHHQPVRRADDGSVISRQTLYDGRDVSLDGLTDVDIRGGDTAGSSGASTGSTTICNTCRPGWPGWPLLPS